MKTSHGDTNPAGGIGFMVMATLMFCLGDTLMKLAASTLPTTETMFVRSLVATSVVGFTAAISGSLRHWRRALVAAMALRAGADACTSLLFQSALGRMPFADVMGINQLQTLSLTAGSALFLGEKVGWHRWSAVGAGLIGGLLIIKPGTSAFDWWAIAAVGAVLFATVREISTRKISSTVPITLVIAISSSFVTLAALMGSLFQSWAHPSTREYAMLIGAGLFILSGQYCMITAIRSAALSVVAPFRYAAMMWALFLGYSVWGHIPDGNSMLGFFTIAVAGLYTFHRERLLQIERNSLVS
jgi:drug/metabolite transporter (DMT)-like permease